MPIISNKSGFFVNKGPQGIQGDVGNTGIQGVTGVGFTQGQLFYATDTASGISTYKLLDFVPDTNPTQYTQVTVKESEGEKFSVAFCSHQLGVTDLFAGNRYINVYCSVDDVGSNSAFHVYSFIRDSIGTETPLFDTYTGNITSNTGSIRLAIGNMPTDVFISPTDRLVLKFYAFTYSLTNRTVNLYYQNGTQTLIQTPDSIVGIIGVTGLQGPTGFQGVTGTGGGGTGIQGVTGPQGVTGVAGGGTGVQGPTGIKGSTGIGIQGSTGINGIQGNTGLVGQTGAQGVTGVAYDGIQQLNDRNSVGLISGGLLSRGTSGKFSVDSGVGYVKTDGTNFDRITWGTFTNQTPSVSGYNYVSINSDASLITSSIELVDNTNVNLGHFYIDPSGAINALWNIPEWIGNYQFKNNNSWNQIFGTMISSGFLVTEQNSPNFKKLNISDGTMFTKLSEFQYGDQTYFYKLLGCSDFYLLKDTNNDNATIDTSIWNNSANPLSTCLVTLSDGSWAKGMLVITNEGVLCYAYPQAEYATKELVRTAPLPFTAPPYNNMLYKDGNAFLCTITYQKNDSSISSGLNDIRPIMQRAFGQGEGNLQGPQGNPGIQGETGIQGQTGIQGMGLTGTQGVTGIGGGSSVSHRLILGKILREL